MRSSRPRPKAPGRWGAALAVLIGALLISATSAHAAAPLSWSAPSGPSGPLTAPTGAVAISCPSSGLCVAVDGAGDAIVSTDPTAATPQWSLANIDGSRRLDGVSCASSTLCVAVDSEGAVLVSTQPTQPGSWTRTEVDASHPLSGVSCASSTLCVAVDGEGGALVSSEPAAQSPAAWSRYAIDSKNALSGVSCVGSELCVAVDQAGNALASANPAGGAGAWTVHRIGYGAALKAVSCTAGGLCVALDSEGRALTSIDPAAPDAAEPLALGPTWSVTRIDSSSSLSSLSCAASGLCVAVTEQGRALASDAPSATPPGWSASTVANAEPGLAVDGIACLPEGFCVAAALSTTGAPEMFTGSVPAPAAVTGAASGLTETTATISGTVNPGDAILGACSFQYGTTTAYGQTVPCAALPPSLDAAEPVSAQLTGLSPGVAYHYRLSAQNGPGSALGADMTFTTPSKIKLLSPHPQIAGIPAVGSLLTCESGLPKDVSGTLSYQWLRNLRPISYAKGRTYLVRDTDSGHHLQCRITATNAAGSVTRTSKFVTIPRGGVPIAAGETVVGGARVKRNDRIQIPVSCSQEAIEGCTIQMALTVAETTRGSKIVAVAASRRPHGGDAHHPRRGGAAHAAAVSSHRARHGHPPRAKLRHLSVTIARKRVGIPTGATRVLTLTVNRAGRMLFAQRRGKRIPALLTVSGTVIGVIEAKLRRERIFMRVPPAPHHHRHSARRRSGAHPHGARAHSGRAHSARAHSARAHAAASSAATDGQRRAAALLSPTPYMGWDTYFALGGTFSETTVLMQASEMIKLGLVHLGYRYVWLDAGWWHGTRNSHGQITVSKAQWPHGIRWLAETLHAAGMRLGVYTDAGQSGCGGAGQGSYGHYNQDANTFASWGVDAVKVDFCGGSRMHLNPRSAYTAFHEAIVHDRPHRGMLLEVCNFLQPNQLGGGLPHYGESAFTSYRFGSQVATSWRTDTDIGRPGSVPFANVLRNLYADAAHPEAAAPGHWNEPDYLGPGEGMTAAQFRTQFSMWAILAAPLMISANLQQLAPEELEALTNQEVIAVDQDPAGVQGRLISAAGAGEVWVKPLADGSRAVALLNTGPTPIPIETSAAAIGMPAAPSYTLRNLWTHTSSATTQAISAGVPGYSTVLLRVNAEG